MRKSKPIRMCIGCRKRELQKELIRLQKIDGKIVIYQGVGRSFYLCKECLNRKNIEKRISKITKIDINSVVELLKELLDNGKN